MYLLIHAGNKGNPHISHIYCAVCWHSQSVMIFTFCVMWLSDICLLEWVVPIIWWHWSVMINDRLQLTQCSILGGGIRLHRPITADVINMHQPTISWKLVMLTSLTSWHWNTFRIIGILWWDPPYKGPVIPGFDCIFAVSSDGFWTRSRMSPEK